MEQDGTGLKHRNRFAVCVVINNGRHAAVWADGQELGLELVAASNVDRDQLVREAALLQHDGDLPAVWRRPVVEVDHALPLRSEPIAPSARSATISADE